MTRERSIVIGVFSIVMVMTIISYWFNVGHSITVPLRDIVYLTAPLLATVFGIWAVSIFGSRSIYSFPLLFLSLGVGCKFIGEILWTVFEDVLHIDPFPSAADYFFLLSYPLFALALVIALKHGRVNWKALNAPLLFLLGFNSIVISGIVAYFDIYLAYDATSNVLANTVAIGYGVADLILFIICLFLLVLAWEYREGRIVRTWKYLFFGFLFTLIADVLFAVDHDAYTNGVTIFRNVIDSLWIIGYLCVGFGFYEFVSLAKDIRNRVR